MLRNLPIRADDLGLVAAGPCDPVMVWEDVSGRRTMTDRQERDPGTNELVWTAYVLPTSADRPEVMQVRVRAAQQPVVTQFGQVTVDDLEVRVAVDKAGKLAQYWQGSGIRDAGQQHRRPGHQGGEHKPGEQAA